MWITFSEIPELCGEAICHTSMSVLMMCEICIDYRVSHNRRTQFWNNAGR